MKFQKSLIKKYHDCKCSKLLCNRGNRKACRHIILYTELDIGISAAGFIYRFTLMCNSDYTGKVPVTHFLVNIVTQFSGDILPKNSLIFHTLTSVFTKHYSTSAQYRMILLVFAPDSTNSILYYSSCFLISEITSIGDSACKNPTFLFAG